MVQNWFLWIKAFIKFVIFYWAFSWSWEHFLWSHSYCSDRISTYWGTTWSTVTTYLYVWIRRVMYKYVCICLSVYVYVWVFKKSILCWNISKYYGSRIQTYLGSISYKNILRIYMKDKLVVWGATCLLLRSFNGCFEKFTGD